MTAKQSKRRASADPVRRHISPELRSAINAMRASETAAKQAYNAKNNRSSDALEMFSDASFEREVREFAETFSVAPYEARKLVRLCNGVNTLRASIAELAGRADDEATLDCADKQGVNPMGGLLQAVREGKLIEWYLLAAYGHLHHAEMYLRRNDVANAMDGLLAAASALPDVALEYVNLQHSMTASSGGKEAGRKAKAKAATWQIDCVDKARGLLKQAYAPHELAGILAKRFNKTSKQVRTVLQAAGVLSARKREVS